MDSTANREDARHTLKANLKQLDLIMENPETIDLVETPETIDLLVENPEIIDLLI